MKLGLSNTVRSQVSGEWTPARFGSDLKLWLRKDTGLQESDGSTPEDTDQITQWTDQSGSGNNMVAPNNYFTYDAATGGAESGDGTNSKFYLATDGSKDVTFTGGFACYARLSLSTVSSSGGTDLFIYDSSSSGSDFFRFQSTTELRGKIDNSTKFAWSYTNPSLDSFNNWGLERDGSNILSAYLNGSAQSRTSGSGYDSGAISGDFVLDAIGGLWDGIFVEIIWVNRGLTASERTSLNTYLNSL
ncbi:MAG: hypothetical protein Unbinned4585contig1001_37 [Prokaryotic dsDNA virus sp.]|nr:MAG: hypothetical protein Unbinned4585contig1001_37 [Prokaryotic dsDNA virus sp.]|tara:strand:+ start:2323 stop:3057 length:735 start_codon:yes stop_codon:yes gene_type:complete